jgi:ribose transport system permease protein
MAAPDTALNRRLPSELFGGWDLGLLALMALLYLGGTLVNPTYFGSVDAFHALLRDSEL